MRSHVPLRHTVLVVVAFVAGMDGVFALVGYLFVQVTVALTRASVALHVVAGALLLLAGARAVVWPRLALRTCQRDITDARPGVHLRDALLGDRVPRMRPHRRGPQQRHPARRPSPRLACPRRLRPRAKSRACHRRQPRIPALANRSGPHLEKARPRRGAPLSRRWCLLPLPGPRRRVHHPACRRAAKRHAAWIALRWGGERASGVTYRPVEGDRMSEPSIGTTLATRLRTRVGNPAKAVECGG